MVGGYFPSSIIVFVFLIELNVITGFNNVSNSHATCGDISYPVLERTTGELISLFRV